MPDITMCNNMYCRDKLHCYRFIATPDKEYQAYFVKKDCMSRLACGDYVEATKNDLEEHRKRAREAKNAIKKG